MTEPPVALVQARDHEHRDEDYEPRKGEPTDDPQLVEVDDVGRGLDCQRAEVDRAHEQSP